ITTPQGMSQLSISGTSGSVQHTSMVNLVVGTGTTTNVTATIGAWPNPVAVGTNLTYEIRVTNQGPVMATGVQVTDVLPATFVSAVSTQGTCSGTDTVTCNLGSLDVLARATVTIVVSPPMTGSLSNTATVMADQSASNSATTVVPVVQSGGVPVD